MMLLSVFQSVEFYVIATLVAAVVVGMAMRPSSRGEARVYMLAGRLCRSNREVPMVEMEVAEDGTVNLVRSGIPPVTSQGALSLVVTVTGLDIRMEERTVFPRPGKTGLSECEAVDTAEFTLDFLAPERYHVQYRSDSMDAVAAMTLHVRPGYRVKRELNA